MATTKQLGWQKLFLILKVLTSCSGLHVSIPIKKYEARSGDEITMTCSYTPANPDAPLYSLQWEAFARTPGEATRTVGTVFDDLSIEITPAYEGRASLQVDAIKKECTLRLTKLTVKDSRNFQCSVTIRGDDEGVTAATTALLVLVPPSKPICSIQGEAEFWHDITLTCLSEEGSPKPTYKWQGYSVENIPRRFPPKTTDENGVLSLFNISSETSGFYICTSTNQVDSASCNFTLAVMHGSMNVGATAGIVGGVLGGLLILVILICCCRRKSKKDKFAEVENELHDRDPSEAGQQYYDDKSRVTKQNLSEYKDPPENLETHVGTSGQMPEDRAQGHDGGKGRLGDGADSDAESQSYRNNHQNDRRGSRDHLEGKRDQYAGSRDQLAEQRDRYSGSRDRLDGQRDRYQGSRERLDDRRNDYRGSRDRLDDGYRGSRDRLDEPRDGYRGSRDRLADQSDGYRGSRDRLDDPRDRYYGSRDRLDEQRDRYHGSRERLDDRSDDRGYNYDGGDY